MSTGTKVEAENENTYATVLESELAKDRSLYTRFDDLTLEVMQKNAAVIAQEASKGISIEEMPATTLKFDLRSGMIHSSEPQKCTLNLLEACRAAWAVNGETLPTTNIVLMDLRVTAVSSTFSICMVVWPHPSRSYHVLYRDIMSLVPHALALYVPHLMCRSCTSCHDLFYFSQVNLLLQHQFFVQHVLLLAF